MKQSNGCSIISSRLLRGALVTLLGAVLMCGTAIAAPPTYRVAPPTYRIVLLPELPGTFQSSAQAISDAGQIIGHSTLSGTSFRSVSWGAPPYVPQLLAELTPGGSAYVSDVNDAGFIVGYSHLAEYGSAAVMWDPSGAIVELGDLPGGFYQSQANAINNFGVVVGSGTATDRVRPVFWTKPGALRRLALNGPIVHLGGKATAVNDFGDIVGYHRTCCNFYAARWPAGQQRMQALGDLSGGVNDSEALAINNAGQVVGYGHSDLGQRAVLWNSDGSMTDLGDIADGNDYAAVDINQVGHIVGRFDKPDLLQHGFLWTAIDGMMDLYDLIDPADPLRAQFGADHVSIYAINASGLIIGGMRTDPEDQYYHAFVLVPQEVTRQPSSGTNKQQTTISGTRTNANKRDGGS